MNRNYRIYTTQLIEMAEEGMIAWETLARAALCYMSEADVKDMAETEEFVPEEEDEDDGHYAGRDARGAWAAK